MTTIANIVDMAKADGVREDRNRQRKKVTRSGKVLSLIRANGEWLAVVVSMTAERDLPVLSKIVPVSALTGSARRKADRWVEWLK